MAGAALPTSPKSSGFDHPTWALQGKLWEVRGDEELKVGINLKMGGFMVMRYHLVMTHIAMENAL